MITDIIFDWDGTLADTLPFLKETFDKTFWHLHKEPMSYAQIRQRIHDNPQHNILLSIFDSEENYAAKRFFHTYTIKNHLNNIKLYNGALEILDFCRQNKIRCHLFSNKRRTILQEELEYFKIDNYFTTICGGGDLITDKPDKKSCQIFQKISQINPRQTLMIGDGPHDTMAAHTLGCPIVIVKTHEKYIGDKPDYQIDKIADFIPLIKTMLY